MIYTETKFAYRHKPTGKWVALETFINNWDVYMHLVDEFVPEDMAYKAINVIEEDLMRSSMNGIEYYRQNSLEFELVEIEVQYKIKQEEYAEIRIWENSTGWPN
jgi:hypothetical protein